MDELLADRAKERERADRAEQRARQLEAQRPPIADARPAASSAAPAGLPEPDPSTFPYGTADPGYVKAVAKYEAAAFVAAERATYVAAEQHARARAEGERVLTAFQQKTAAARSKHADFDAVALEAPTDIQPGTLADLWVMEDEAGAEILYHLQSPAHADERRRILALPYAQQVKELVRLGDRLTAPDPAARSTAAPPPPPTLSTRATPGDAVERAIRDDDTLAYNKAMNARDLARLNSR